jgi:hypothetical protein
MDEAIHGWETCTMHTSPLDCADALIHVRGDGLYGIIIHDGGSSIRIIGACPFCAAKVPED